ncbi:signal peptidase I [Kitasatospora aureofaciens]|uniref:Signal peptidase I n=1 Tax=Kitasatospora aureofaciens TaxID=1894 RepID=A0A8H9HKA6_KITAU|nr:signal peptidase I [Kitasatospora aureofaciens]GGU69829.1 signal peptidase I [Kitasatospora aureofaciens]
MSVQQSTESGGSGGTEERPTTGPDGTGTEGDQPAAVQEENAAAEPDGTPAAGAKPARKKRPFWQELPILLVIALLLSLGIKTFFVQAFSIPSGSMENTLQIGDRVLVDKLTPWFGAEPERGEVVVFHDPGGWLEDTAPKDDGLMGSVQKVLSTVGLMPSADEKDLIKRVIAVGGDTVECNAGSPVKVNGVALDEPYLFPGATPCDNDPVGTVTVPKGKLWVMGDHRNNSRDSRPHQNLTGDGFVPVDDVVGRAFVVAWPISNWSTLPVPDTFDKVPSRAAAALPEQAPPAPAALALAGVVPIALWRRRRSRRSRRRTG